VRDNRWADEGQHALQPQDVGQRLGIVGLGRIGKAIAARAPPSAWLSPTPAATAAGVPSLPPFPARRRWPAAVDFLVVITPGGEATRKLIDREVLEALGPARLPDQRRRAAPSSTKPRSIDACSKA
jgi:lactate dehydrogenase-like 2-hydroxyacid dehydrogenase